MAKKARPGLLNSSPVGVRGCGYLGKVLTQNDRLTKLVLDHNPIGDEGVELLGDGLKWARAASPWPVPISLPLPLCRGWHRWGASLFVQQALIQPFELPWLS
eukprot:EG_transcript_32804